ncbi:hypothetical protein Naga_102854g1 [Nannochloropsis gaditana]|uniref:Uncharacterized protein n=1 Tax=Nannochloropsis gaditana TaxID=72520 RepID=W7TQM3_9STRA|nr:hypothetical protein Naga_102854g1 [Nannochloropsis gaditana]
MRHLPSHVRERLESQHPQFAPYMLPEEKAARREAEKKNRQLFDENPGVLDIPLREGEALHAATQVGNPSLSIRPSSSLSLFLPFLPPL